MKQDRRKTLLAIAFTMRELINSYENNNEKN